MKKYIICIVYNCIFYVENAEIKSNSKLKYRIFGHVSVNGDFHFSTEFLKVVELALNLEENVKRMMTEEHGRRF